jgi:hypothetical protein
VDIHVQFVSCLRENSLTWAGVGQHVQKKPLMHLSPNLHARPPRRAVKHFWTLRSLCWLLVCALLTIACRKCLIKFHRTLSSIFLQHGLLSSWLLYWTHCMHLSKESLVNISGCGFWSRCPILPSQKLTHGECCSFCSRLY